MNFINNFVRKMKAFFSSTEEQLLQEIYEEYRNKLRQYPGFNGLVWIELPHNAFTDNLKIKDFQQRIIQYVNKKVKTAKSELDKTRTYVEVNKKQKIVNIRFVEQSFKTRTL